MIKREKVDITEYANLITKALPKGILLNTNGDKFNAMVIGWGHIGTLWSRPTFHVYVRKGRYTRSQLDKTGEFTVSIPLEGPDPSISKICGSMSGSQIDKAKEAGLTLAEPQSNHTPGIVEYPLTVECRILYAQEQDLEKIPEDIRERMYPQDVPGTYPMANRDAHIMYVGQILDAYILKNE
ncbi:MAG: flavin reductase [Lachnospiraceae bacterium]|nr:flavin reductase [Lachnospiraceae bacterium]